VNENIKKKTLQLDLYLILWIFEKAHIYLLHFQACQDLLNVQLVISFEINNEISNRKKRNYDKMLKEFIEPIILFCEMF